MYIKKFTSLVLVAASLFLFHCKNDTEYPLPYHLISDAVAFLNEVGLIAEVEKHEEQDTLIHTHLLVTDEGFYMDHDTLIETATVYEHIFGRVMDADKWNQVLMFLALYQRYMETDPEDLSELEAISKKIQVSANDVIEILDKMDPIIQAAKEVDIDEETAVAQEAFVTVEMEIELIKLSTFDLTHRIGRDIMTRSRSKTLAHKDLHSFLDKAKMSARWKTFVDDYQTTIKSSYNAQAANTLIEQFKAISKEWKAYERAAEIESTTKRI